MQDKTVQRRSFLADTAAGIATVAIAKPSRAAANEVVRVEKPLSQSQWERRQVVNAASKTDHIVQVGTQPLSNASNILGNNLV